MQIIKGQHPHRYWKFAVRATLKHRKMLRFFSHISLSFTVTWILFTQQILRFWSVQIYSLWSLSVLLDSSLPIVASAGWRLIVSKLYKNHRSKESEQLCIRWHMCIHFNYWNPAIQVFLCRLFSHSFLHVLLIYPLSSSEFEWKRNGL